MEFHAFSNINLDTCIYENRPDSVPKKKTCHWGTPKTEIYLISDWLQCAAKKLSICQLVFEINCHKGESAFKPVRSLTDSMDVWIFVPFGIIFLIFLKWNILPQQFLWHHWIISLKDVGSCYQTYLTLFVKYIFNNYTYSLIKNKKNPKNGCQCASFCSTVHNLVIYKKMTFLHSKNLFFKI